MTVTESAAMAAVTALFVSLVVYRGFRWTRMLDVIAEAFASAGVIMLIIATALVFGHWMTGSGVPGSARAVRREAEFQQPCSSCW